MNLLISIDILKISIIKKNTIFTALDGLSRSYQDSIQLINKCTNNVALTSDKLTNLIVPKIHNFSDTLEELDK